MAWTELEAVNTMLRAIGEDPVSSVTSGSTDAGVALNTLRSIAKEVQSRGWHVNTEIEYPLSPNASGEIQLPSNTLRADPDGTWWHKDYVKRGLKFYDRENHSFDIEDDSGGNITATLILELDWEDLTTQLQAYIIARASREFMTASEAVEGPTRDILRREAEAWQELSDEEIANEDLNVLRDSPIRYWIDRRGPTDFGY